jgi:hypothetical protein
MDIELREAFIRLAEIVREHLRADEDSQTGIPMGGYKPQSYFVGDLITSICESTYDYL